MPMSPGQLLLMRRSGPGMGPGAPGAGAPGVPPTGPGGPSGPGGGGGEMIGAALGKLMSEMQGSAQTDYLSKVLNNTKSTLAVLVAKTDQSHPEVAKHISRAWTAVSAAVDAVNKVKDSSKSVASGPLGFSGAMPTQQPENQPGSSMQGAVTGATG